MMRTLLFVLATLLLSPIANAQTAEQFLRHYDPLKNGLHCEDRATYAQRLGGLGYTSAGAFIVDTEVILEIYAHPSGPWALAYVWPDRETCQLGFGPNWRAADPRNLPQS